MLSLIKNNNPVTVVLLLMICIGAKYGVIVHSVAPVPVPNHYFYNCILHGMSSFLGKNALGFSFVLVVNIFLQSLYIVNILSRYKLFAKVTYIPSFVYIVLTSLFPAFNAFGETFMLNWILLGSIDIMFGFSQTNQPRKLIFNAGFVLALAVLFQPSLILFFLLLLVSMVMFRSFDLGEWSVAIMGFLTPVYFFIAILFLKDHLYVLSQWWHLGFSFTSISGSHTAFIVTLSGMAFLLLAGVVGIQLNLSTSNIYIRRNWIVITFYLIISLLVAFMTDLTISSAWLLALPPLSIIVSQGLLLEKNKVFSNFILYFSLILLIFCQLANK